ncbi:MAG: ATP-binding protein [Bacteroidales bacterium]|nr:ATP-binding protein [Bacteroidales bacterium]
MRNRIRLVIIALGIAVVIPFGISMFLIQKSYELERKKFDIEVMQIAGNVFYSFRADYLLLDSIVSIKYLPLIKKSSDMLSGELLKKDFLKVYKSYAHLKDTLGQELLRHGYEDEFEYALEITYFKVVMGDIQIPIVSDSTSVDGVLRLFGDLKSKNTAASYGFYFMGTNNYIRINLYVDYPERNKFIVSRIWPTIIGILIAMFGLIAILIYTIKVIFWQKKISDMKSHFIDNITHEFNTPVSTLKVIATNISQLNRSINSDSLNQISKRINNQANRLSALIEKVLTVSLNQGQGYRYHFKVLSLHNLLDETVKKFMESNSGKISTLKLNMIAENNIIVADDYYLSVAILNMLDNAVKYAKEKAEIEISTSDEAGNICVKICDKGIGIKASEMKMLFKRFYRGGAKNVYKTAGLGLGLSIVKQVINAHGGKLLVTSKPGIGTEFSIIIPFKNKDLIAKINQKLLKAASEGDFEAVKKSLEDGADINACDSSGKTALMMTINTDDANTIVNYLMDSGANVSLRDKGGKNVLDHLILPEAPPENHENAYEAWIHSTEHYLYSLLSQAISKKDNL